MHVCIRTVTTTKKACFGNCMELHLANVYSKLESELMLLVKSGSFQCKELVHLSLHLLVNTDSL